MLPLLPIKLAARKKASKSGEKEGTSQGKPNKKDKPGNRATFRRNFLRKGKSGAKSAKAAKKREAEEPALARALHHGEYDLGELSIPLEALPQGGAKNNKGKHSYTVRSSSGKAAIEVLLRNRAFFCKVLSPEAAGPKGQVSWKAAGIESAWELCKSRVGFD
jgi:hypothetical protein